MNKKGLWIGIGVVILVLILIFVFMKPKGTEAPIDTAVQGDATQTPGAQQENQVQKGSFKQLIASEKPQQCTVKTAYNGMTAEGTTFIMKGKMRADTTSVVNGKTMHTHMIIDGNTVYTWVDGMTTGFQMTLNAEGQVQTQVQSGNQAQPPVSLDQQVDYTCSNWTVDATKFQKPASINFMSMTNIKIPATAQ